MVRWLAMAVALAILPLTLNVQRVSAAGTPPSRAGNPGATTRVGASPQGVGWYYVTGSGSWTVYCPYDACGSQIKCSEEGEFDGTDVYAVSPYPSSNPCSETTDGTPSAGWSWYWDGCTGGGSSTLSCGANFQNTDGGLYNCYQFRIYITTNGTTSAKMYQSVSNGLYPCS